MSRTAAINEKCKDCIYDPAVKGTWREQVELCTSVKSCALWPYRPRTVITINAERKAKAGAGINIDALVADMDDEDEVVEA